MTSIVAFFALVAAPCGVAGAQVWEDATESTLGETAEWSNKVELADLDGDGLVDIVFANGGNYSSAGTPEPNRVFLNRGPDEPFLEATEAVFGPAPDLARAIKVRDLSGDGVPDIIVATTYETQPRLYLGLGEGAYVEVTDWYVPEDELSAGDVEAGDVDGDGDLDLVFADWGAGSPSGNAGGVTRLWLNNGTGGFEDATATHMPLLPVRWSWDLELADVDNDWDLDILVSCKSCEGSVLLDNDGTGHFSDASSRLPQFTNNYEFEAMDLTGDGWLDLVTINDGPGLSQHLLVNDGAGGFEDGTDTYWPAGDNPGSDDNAVVFLDFDSDGDSDFLIGSLSGLDRLLINGLDEEDGTLSMLAPVFGGPNTPGTLAIQVAHLDDDGRLDVVQSQGELASPDKLYVGVGVPEDTAAPHLARIEATHEATADAEQLTVRARIHDGKTPSMPHDWQTPPTLMWAPDAQDAEALPLTWYGEHLWTLSVPLPDSAVVNWWLCVTDRAGNEACSEAEVLEPSQPPVGEDADVGGGAGDAAGSDGDAAVEVEVLEPTDDAGPVDVTGPEDPANPAADADPGATDTAAGSESDTAGDRPSGADAGEPGADGQSSDTADPADSEAGEPAPDGGSGGGAGGGCSAGLGGSSSLVLVAGIALLLAWRRRRWSPGSA